PQKRDEEKLRFALDTQTPEDIDFISVEEVNEDFHSRYCKHSNVPTILRICLYKNPLPEKVKIRKLRFSSKSKRASVIVRTLF
ncbi:Pseudouridine synthase, partial [human gut metagenome]